MTASTSPIDVTIGSQIIDKSVVPIISEIPIQITSYNLKPGAIAHHWFDDKLVDQYVQPVSLLTVNIGYNAENFVVGEPIYCPATGGYAVVKETSQTTILQLEENYITINISNYATANTFGPTDYVANDIVYLANNSANVYANSMSARVAYWDYANGTMVLSVLNGAVSNSSSNRVLYKINSNKLSNVNTLVVGNKFPVGNIVFSTLNTAKRFTPSYYVSNHGLITTTSSNNVLQISGYVNANTIGNTIYIVSGTGVGQLATITSVDSTNSRVTLNTAFSTVSGNTSYGIGNITVDNIGIASGIFHVPSDPNFNFQTGSRLITVNDSTISAIDNAATMLATAVFVAAGQLPIGTSTTPVAPSTPQISPAANSTVVPSSPTSSSISNNGQVNNPAASADPLVQTFFTPKTTNPGTDYGCFATSVNLFFQSIPTGNSTQFPVSVYLVTTENGFPTTNVLATSTVRYENINTTDGVHTFPSAANANTHTNFAFADPVYLAPGTEYGIVVYSESPDYYVWISQLGDTIINSTTLVSQSPYVGSFFKSQNASAWTPIQNQMLMFVLNKAVFSSNALALQFNVKAPLQNVYMDMVTLHSADLTFPPAQINYGIMATSANGGVQDSAFKPVTSDTPLFYGADLTNSSIGSNRRRVITAGNANSCLVQAVLKTNNSDVSPFFHSEALTLVSFANIINPGSLDENSISITSPGNHINAANIVVTISAPTGDGAITATAKVPSLNGNSVTGITIVNPGAGYVVSPTITLAEPGSPSNATAVIIGENSTSGGNDYARYITRPITLAPGFAAGDLNVFLQAIRPQGTDINVYYKVLSASDTDPLSAKSWQLMSKVSDIYSPDQQTAINLAYNTGTNALGQPNGSVAYVQNGITYPIGGTYITFALKITLTANDPTVAPEVQNYRAIACPQG